MSEVTLLVRGAISNQLNLILSSFLVLGLVYTAILVLVAFDVLEAPFPFHSWILGVQQCTFTWIWCLSNGY